MTEKIDITVIELAKEIVMKPSTKYGYSDIGDILVRYLQEECSAEHAKRELSFMASDYERARKE